MADQSEPVIELTETAREELGKYYARRDAAMREAARPIEAVIHAFIKGCAASQGVPDGWSFNHDAMRFEPGRETGSS